MRVATGAAKLIVECLVGRVLPELIGQRSLFFVIDDRYEPTSPGGPARGRHFHSAPALAAGWPPNWPAITGIRWQPLTLVAGSFGRIRLASQLSGGLGFPGATCIKEDQQ